jgi:S-adenosylmethionine hydrolase
MNAPRPLVTLTTDFGLADHYAAQMKGVILSISPDAALVDITHLVPPQDVTTGSLLLDQAVDAFPGYAIHLVVVDPGVGTDRRPVAVETAAGRFVAPDNGVLGGVLERHPPRRAVRLDNPRYWRRSVSSTFHGRDLFAAVAAHWSLGVDIAEFGPSLEGPLVRIPSSVAVREGNAIRGRILRADSFGNLMTNIPGSWLGGAGGRLVIEVGRHRIHGLSTCYAEAAPQAPLALINSAGLLEIAVCCGRADESLGVRPGDTLIVRGWDPSFAAGSGAAP